MNTNFDKALSQLQKITNQSFAKDFYLESLQKKIYLKEINVSQQKILLDHAIASKQPEQINKTDKFAEINFNLIKDNITEGLSEEEIQNLTIWDKNLLSLALRSLSNEKVTLTYFTKNDTEPESKAFVEFNISDIINKYNASYKEILTKKNIIQQSEQTNTTFSINLKLPTIIEEIEVEKFMPDNHTAGDVFLYEMTKYIESLSVDNLLINFKELTLDQKLILIQNLPSNVGNSIINEINTIKDKLYKPLDLEWQDKFADKHYYNIIINSEWFLNY